MTIVYTRNGYDVNRTTFENINYLRTINLIYEDWTNNSMDNAFRNCSNLYKVQQINENIVSMVNTFENCVNLVNAPELPNSVENISHIFDNCVKLKNVTIPNSVQDMSYAFNNCIDITITPELPNSLTNMSYAFSNCVNIPVMPIIPDTTIDMSGAFYNCSNIKNFQDITIGVTNLYQAFENCVKLEGNLKIYSSTITNAYNCFDGTTLDKNIFIQFKYANYEDTDTYKSFINAGYGTDPNNRKNGVCLVDGSGIEVDLSDYIYTIDNKFTAHLTKYIGDSTVVVQPVISEE